MNKIHPANLDPKDPLLPLPLQKNSNSRVRFEGIYYIPVTAISLQSESVKNETERKEKTS